MIEQRPIKLGPGKQGTINAREAAHFGAMAADWWDPAGSSRMLHRLNPVRLRFIRNAIDAQFGTERNTRRPLAGRSALDVGCGAGLLAEPLARLGAEVTGVDAARENIAAARDHAAAVGLAIDYQPGDMTAVEGVFDLVTCVEVIEHVEDQRAFIAALGAKVAPGGLLVLSTPNRTNLSRLAVVTIGETFGGIPPGTHNWDAFVMPGELEAMLHDKGLVVTMRSGIAFSVASGFTLSDDERLNYMLACVAR